MKKLIIILTILTMSVSANAFYTDLRSDILKLKEGIMIQHKLTPDQKKQVFDQYSQMIKTERAKVYTKIARSCERDIIKLCLKDNERNSIDNMVKCLSKNKFKLSSECTQSISESFRKN